MTAYVYLLAPTTTVTARIAPRSAGLLPSSPWQMGRAGNMRKPTCAVLR